MNLRNRSLCVFTSALVLAAKLQATQFHVAAGGLDSNPGSRRAPFRTIQCAAEAAQPGDVITVHEGVYRERVNPPRGGTSDKQRITYQAAKGEKVVITGSDPAKGWVKVSGDAWKLTLPNTEFGNFNPYADRIFGDWFAPNKRVHHTGSVYLDGDWMIEATNLDQVLAPLAKTPLWFATVDGDDGKFLLNLARITTAAGASVSGAAPSYRYGGKVTGNCSSHILNGHWMRFDGLDFGKNSESVTLNLAVQSGFGGVVELRLDTPGGEYLGRCEATSTGDWNTWKDLTIKIKPTSGKRSLCLVFKGTGANAGFTTIHAQFPKGIDPNAARVEINKRQTVFYPSRTGINYITVRGFTLLNGAANWAPPSSEQPAIIGTHWSKGWIFENNEVAYSKCAGISLGKYGDGTDNTNDAGAADPFTACVRRALENGWSSETIGHHTVRSNHIHHCEQTGIVGSMGCAFSTVEGNEIHDIHVRKLFGGWEQAGIKFHGFVDGVIRDNHIHHNGSFGIWLDWMAQGTQVAGQLLHDNDNADIFCEMQHGPILLANNLCLSRTSVLVNSKGLAFAHNLLAGAFNSVPYDARKTPWHPPHATTIAGLADAPSGDHRLYNNLVCGTQKSTPGGLLDKIKLPCTADGNVYVLGAKPAAFDATATVDTNISAQPKLTQKADGWYLNVTEDPEWKKTKRQLVDTATLGKAKIPNARYENRDGTPLTVGSDYFGKPRDENNPFPGPFETPVQGEIKVWPRH